MIEGFVFVEDHENIFYQGAKTFDRFFPGKGRLIALCPVPEKRQHIRAWIGLQGHHWLVSFLRQGARREANLSNGRRSQGGARLERESKHTPLNAFGSNKRRVTISPFDNGRMTSECHNLRGKTKNLTRPVTFSRKVPGRRVNAPCQNITIEPGDVFLAAGVQKDFCPGGLLPVHQRRRSRCASQPVWPPPRRCRSSAGLAPAEGIALSPRPSRDASPMRQCSLARPSYPGNAWGAVACGSSNPASRT